MEETKIQKTVLDGFSEKKWKWKPVVIAVGLVVTHIAAVAIGYAIGVNTGATTGSDVNPEQL